MKLMVARTALAWVVAGACVAGCAAGASAQRKESTPSETAAAYNLQLGLAYLQQGNLEVAKEKLERALKQSPRDHNVHSAMAMLSERLGNRDLADRYYSSALRLAPRDPAVSNNYAVYLCRTGRAAEGVERFLAAARNPLYRTPEAAYANAGVCQRGAGQLDAAAGNFARALKIRPNFATAAYELADLELARNQAAAARAVIDQFVGSFNNVTPELLYLGVRVARIQGDRLGEEKFARRLRMDFPNSEPVRRLN